MQMIPPAQLQELRRGIAADLVLELSPIMVDLAGQAARAPTPILTPPQPVAQTPSPKRKRAAKRGQNSKS